AGRETFMASLRATCASATAAVFTLALASSAFGAVGQQVVLSPSNVIGGTAPYNLNGWFVNSNVLDTQTGDLHETQQANGSPNSSGYWINPDNGPNPGSIVVDLGAGYKLGEIDL